MVTVWWRVVFVVHHRVQVANQSISDEIDFDERAEMHAHLQKLDVILLHNNTKPHVKLAVQEHAILGYDTLHPPYSGIFPQIKLKHWNIFQVIEV